MPKVFTSKQTRSVLRIGADDDVVPEKKYPGARQPSSRVAMIWQAKGIRSSAKSVIKAKSIPDKYAKSVHSKLFLHHRLTTQKAGHQNVKQHKPDDGPHMHKDEEAELPQARGKPDSSHQSRQEEEPQLLLGDQLYGPVDGDDRHGAQGKRDDDLHQLYSDGNELSGNFLNRSSQERVPRLLPEDHLQRPAVNNPDHCSTTVDPMEGKSLTRAAGQGVRNEPTSTHL